MKKDNLLRNSIIFVLFFLTFWFGIRPIFSGEEFERRVGKIKGPAGENQYAVVIFGTEPEGIAAALACARMGLKTLLVTEDIDPGSYIKSALISYTVPDYARINGKKRKLNTGIYTEFFGETGGNFSSAEYTASMKKTIEKERNLIVLYNAGFLSAEVNNSLLDSVTLYHDGEKKKIQASIFIDATEDGDVLSLCSVPFYSGSGDIHVPDAYMPLGYNFVISNVNWENMEKIRKQDQNINDFQMALQQYKRYSPKTKITNLSFIAQPDNDMVISGIRMRQVNVADPERLEEDFQNALAEAKQLTSFLQYAFVPFDECTFRAGPADFYIPENRHYEGRYSLLVEDILENRDFPNKIVMASAPVDAEKFISAEFSEEYSYILGNPVVYSIPLDCFITKKVDNLMMVGKKASFTSLASTSAGRMAVSITGGESVGIAAAYSYLNDLTPAELSESSQEIFLEYKNLLKRTGITLLDFDVENSNSGHWAWPYVKVLTEYGLVAGGIRNDYLFDVEAYQENLAILLINMIVKVVPETYTLDLDNRVREYKNRDPLTGEKASEILLKIMDVSYPEGQAFTAAKEKGLLPSAVQEKISPDKVVTMDSVYALTVHLIERLQK